MKDYRIATTIITRVEYRMETPADWVDVDKMWHHVATAWRTANGHPVDKVPSDEALQYRTHDEYVVISYEVAEERVTR